MIEELIDDSIIEEDAAVLDNRATIANGRIIASNLDRFSGHLIDLICFFPLFIGYIFLMEHFFGEIKEGEFFRQLLLFVCYVLLLFIVEAIFSRTPGKIARGTILVNFDGSKPKVKNILLRNICRMIPFDSFSFFGSDKVKDRGWHDSISKTYVVYVKKRVISSNKLR